MVDNYSLLNVLMRVDNKITMVESLWWNI